jgi:hypothetical protein
MAIRMRKDLLNIGFVLSLKLKYDMPDLLSLLTLESIGVKV